MPCERLSNQFHKVILIFLALFVLSTSVQANQCLRLFISDPFTKQKMDLKMTKMVPSMVKELKNSTTGARVENKWTLSKNKIETMISNLEQELSQFNIVIGIRDELKPDKKNVTHTVYLEQFELNLKDSGLEISKEFDSANVTFKPRIRKYGTINNGQQINIENIEFADFTKNYSFVEFKFPDARYKGAVFKPRMYMADKYINMFGTKDFLIHFDKIMKETLAHKLNSKDQESVKAMLKFFQIGHQKNFRFAKIAVNLYERISYAIDFFDNSLDAVKFQIQITLDKSISLFIYELGRTVEAYQPDHTVIEVKTPVEYAKYSLASNLSKIPGYLTFLKFISQVRQNHLPEYMEGVGKNGHGHREYLIEALSKSINNKP